MNIHESMIRGLWLFRDVRFAHWGSLLSLQATGGTIGRPVSKSHVPKESSSPLTSSRSACQAKLSWSFMNIHESIRGLCLFRDVRFAHWAPYFYPSGQWGQRTASASKSHHPLRGRGDQWGASVWLMQWLNPLLPFHQIHSWSEIYLFITETGA